MRKNIRVSTIDVNTTSSGGYYYSQKISISAELPADAVVLAVTFTDWASNSAGAITMFANCEEKAVQIMGTKNGSVGALFIDVLYM